MNGGDTADDEDLKRELCDFRLPVFKVPKAMVGIPVSLPKRVLELQAWDRSMKRRGPWEVGGHGDPALTDSTGSPGGREQPPDASPATASCLASQPPDDRRWTSVI